MSNKRLNVKTWQKPDDTNIKTKPKAAFEESDHPQTLGVKKQGKCEKKYDWVPFPQRGGVNMENLEGKPLKEGWKTIQPTQRVLSSPLTLADMLLYPMLVLSNIRLWSRRYEK